MTHDELVQRAVRWLYGHNCWVVFTEPPRYGEQPDAIGWRYNGVSVAVECKVSRLDWEGDKSRKERRYPRRLGQYRWYMVTSELMEKPPPPLPALWGLVVCHPKQVRTVINARRQPLAWVNHAGECNVLCKGYLNRLRDYSKESDA